MKFSNARVEPLFCSLNLLFFHVLVAVLAFKSSAFKRFQKINLKYSSGFSGYYQRNHYVLCI